MANVIAKDFQVTGPDFFCFSEGGGNEEKFLEKCCHRVLPLRLSFSEQQ